MKDETIIKDLLSKDLKKISSENFNEKIIKHLDIPVKKERLVLFDQSSIVKIFLVTSLFILKISLNKFKELPQEVIIIGLIISISPLFFLLFNKIYQLPNQKINSNENYNKLLG